MRVNLYLWNTIKYRSFADAVAAEEVTMIAHYIEVGSEEYQKINKSNSLILALTGQDIIYSVKEVSYATDKINGSL